MKKTDLSQIKGVRRGSADFFENKYSDSEVVIGLVGAVGTEQSRIVEVIKDRLQTAFRYRAELIHVSRDVISDLYLTHSDHESEYDRVQEL
ncbi:hypothetical protein [Cohnella kolymensis]|uniref:hypothetical protein n=1 Tax=Cohnella kolymensis TaxID=1590652 RepID=UPI00190F28BF|nr:hypothetical protein [Cohnella kolymensis]